ncbi:MAG: HRDC domain-containing protein [Isosphaeraceae bacterium]
MAQRSGCDEQKTGVQGVSPCSRAVFGKPLEDPTRMGLRFFAVPVRDSSACEQELNRFLSGHKVVSIERHLIDQGVNSFWAICVDYLSHSPGEAAFNPNLSRSRVDYKTILTPEDFAVFSRLRQLRKELAQTEAVPVYALFTNEQLAQMVQRRCQSRSDLSQIEGIGENKIDKYAERLLPLLLTLEAQQDASSGKPV